MRSGWSAAKSARRSGRRSSQRSARLRMLSVATCEPVHRAQPGCRGRGSGMANENVEPRPSSDSTRMRPPCGLDDVPRDGQPETGPAAPPAGLVGLVEALEDPRLVGRGRCRSRGPRPRPRPPPPTTRDADGRPRRRRGLNFTALWSEVDQDLPEPVLVAADRRDRLAGRRCAASTPWRSANSRRRSTEATASRPRSTSSSMQHGPPLSIRDRSSSSSTIWTRWSVSTSILPIRSRIRSGIASPAVSASRASVSASRLTVVSGVRSSCDRLSMNSARMRWSRRSSETSCMTSQTPGTGDRRARTVSVGPSSRGG